MKNKEFIITITIICFILGLMLTMQLKTVQVNEDKSNTRTSEVQAQYAELKKNYDAKLVEIEELNKVLEEYRKAETDEETVELLKAELKKAQQDAGLTNVRGAGLTVVMEDSLADFGSGIHLNNYLVHDEDILKVVPINKHLTDDVTSDEIINLHAQKNDINSQLQTIQDNINQVYTTIITTDFSQQVTISQQSLQAQIQQYYTERTSLQKQLNAIIDNINSKAMDLRITGSEVKYRIRGIAKYEDIEKYIQSISDDKVYIVGMDLEYKYKSTSKDTTSINVINSSTFTDWIKLENIDRQRKLVFNNAISSFNLDFVEYNTTDNIIKWNQIDIPIQEGEDVIIRVRYKINIGQPFFNLYTPWSDEMTMSFPAEYENNVEVTSIIDTNREDSIKAAFSKTLIDEGYAEHVQNKVVSSEQTFYHQPENIYSGFNTAENNLISLKDKLTAMSNDIEK